MIQRKMRNNNSGFSLVELLVCVIVMSILALILSVGLQVALKEDYYATTDAEAQTIASTITEAVAGELRYARNVDWVGKNDAPPTTQGALTTFGSATYGPGVSLSIDGNGYVVANVPPAPGAAAGKIVPLVPEATYGIQGTGVATYKARNLSIDYNAATQLFTVSITVQDSAKASPDDKMVSVQKELTVHCLSAE